jgi:hypothetical protein
VNTPDFVAGVLGSIPRPLHVALDGITSEQLVEQPADHCNTIAWLVWHLSRTQDRIVSDLVGQEQAWVAGGWHAKFGRAADSSETGIGHSPEQVLSIRPDSPQLLFDYYDAVFNRTSAYLQRLTPADLTHPVDPKNPEVTVGDRLRVCILDNVQHAGQAAFLRGLLENKRVYPS